MGKQIIVNNYGWFGCSGSVVYTLSCDIVGILYGVDVEYYPDIQVQENMIMDRFNMNAFNPAYVGSEGREVSFTSRSAWKGISQSPKTNYFYYSGNPKKNLSFGASVISNRVFIDTRTQYSIDASYRLNLNEGGNLFLGVKAGASSKKTDLDGLPRITNVSN